MSIVCKKCGGKMGADDKFCGSCGTPKEESASVVTQNQVEVTNSTEIDKHAKTGFTLGLCSIIAWILPLAGYPVTICGIIYSIKGLDSKINNGKAIAGLILSIIFLIITLINSILGVMLQFKGQ